MLNEAEIIKQCKSNERKAQQALYEHYAPIMLGICIRYLQDKMIAEDVMHEGFMQIFSKINQYAGTGSFEGWIKRVMVNTALMYLRQNSKHIIQDIEKIKETDIQTLDEEVENNGNDPKALIQNAHFSQTDILAVVEELPEGFRTVFNLYALEGYKHKEIAEMLNISEGTSKSQLLRARKLIQKKLVDLIMEKKSVKTKSLYHGQ